LDTSQLATLIPLSIGGVVALLILGAGYLVLAGRRPQAAEPPLETEDLPEFDPFVYGSPKDKRRALRRQGNPVAVMISDAEVQIRPYQGMVIDRSMGGLCLGVDQEIPVGTVLSIRPARTAELIPWVQVEVRNSRQIDGFYELGRQFVKTPPSAVLWLFG